MRYDPDSLRRFYDAFADREWMRLENDPYGRLVIQRQQDLLARFVAQGAHVVDVGCGPGRFARAIVAAGARVTLVDLSAVQLALAAATLAAAGVGDGIAASVQADLVDLSPLPTHGFDVAVCLGAPLSYAAARRHDAAASLRRVVKPGGIILASVPGRYGTVANLVRRGNLDILRAPGDWRVDTVLTSGDLPGFPSPIAQPHPAMHLFTAAELAALFDGCSVLELASVGVAAFPDSPALAAVAADADAWRSAVAIERRLGSEPSLLDAGSLLMIAVRVPG